MSTEWLSFVEPLDELPAPDPTTLVRPAGFCWDGEAQDEMWKQWPYHKLRLAQEALAFHHHFTVEVGKPNAKEGAALLEKARVATEKLDLYVTQFEGHFVSMRAKKQERERLTKEHERAERSLNARIKKTIEKRTQQQYDRVWKEAMSKVKDRDLGPEAMLHVALKAYAAKHRTDSDDLFIDNTVD